MRTTWIVLLLSASVVLGRDTDFPLETGNPSVLLVKRKKTSGAQDIRNFHQKHGGRVTRFRHIPWDAVETVNWKGIDRSLIVRRYKASPLFEKVCFEKVYGISRTPNDPLFSQQWALSRIEAAAAWDKATSNNVVVAVIDTGIDYSHPDLQANLWTGPAGEHGYTASGGIIAAGGRDDHYHGTHVAGTIGAVGNNGLGVAGLNWRTKILSLKFIGASGFGATRDAILCIEKMIDLKQAGHNIRVSNNSWGGFGRDPALEDAFLEAQNNGIINVCAAGNNGLDIDSYDFLPAGFDLDGIVSVQASTPADDKADFSNYGVIGTDLLAPGQGILSCKTNGGYWNLSGTSMASPHVAGALAMLFGFNPGLLPTQAKTILLQPASYDQTSFRLSTTAGGRLNLRKLWNNPAIDNPPPPNHAPALSLNVATNLIIIPTASSITLTASATDADGDSVSYHTTATAFRDNWMPEVWWERPHFAFSAPTNQIRVTTLPLALDQAVKLRFSAIDGRGGAALRRQTVWSFRDERKVRNITAAIRGFRFWLDAQGRAWHRLDVDTNLAPGITYGIEVRPQPSPWGDCCGEPNKDTLTPMSFPAKGAYAARPFIIDRDGNFTTGPQSYLVVSNSTQVPPLARLTLNTKRGVAPLTVIGDMSASSRGSATRLHYGVFQWNQGGASTDIFNPLRQFTLTEPGVYELLFYCADMESDLQDRIVEFITVLPAVPGRLQITRSGSGVRLSWNAGVLQEAAAAEGPWVDSESQSNPQVLSVVAGGRFFKLR